MTFAEIKQIAVDHGVRVVGVKKVDIVRSIQQKEGNTPCFASGKVSECGQSHCLWVAACD
ncbi:MAG: SAP domain-containing protein [Desulfuromonadaceae bacterium]|nr:SAP domain-containing protein [Desulfuromonadaceae bacterium]MDD5104498.1 SAP domain-containing protein [Desulfuromonadaceae bacterium]